MEEIFFHLLEHVGGIFFLSCNYDVKDFNLPSPFYYELLQWWSEFRDTFAEEKDYQNIIWNSKEIKIDNKPVYLKNNRIYNKILDRDWFSARLFVT